MEVRSRLLLAYSKELARCNRTTLKGTAPLAPCSDFLELVHLHGMEFLKASLEASTAKRIQSVMDTLLDLKDFQLYPLIARFAVTLARHEESLSEFDWKGEHQERATMFHYETALQLLKSVKCLEEAQEVFDEAVSLERGGQRMIAWTQLWQTPSVYVRGLRPVSAWWEATDLPLAEAGLAVHMFIFGALNTDFERLPCGQPLTGVMLWTTKKDTLRFWKRICQPFAPNCRGF